VATAQLSAMEKVDKTSEFLQKLTQHLVRLIYARRHTRRKRERERNNAGLDVLFVRVVVFVEQQQRRRFCCCAFNAEKTESSSSSKSSSSEPI